MVGWQLQRCDRLPSTVHRGPARLGGGWNSSGQLDAVQGELLHGLNPELIRPERLHLLAAHGFQEQQAPPIGQMPALMTRIALVLQLPAEASSWICFLICHYADGMSE